MLMRNSFICVFVCKNIRSRSFIWCSTLSSWSTSFSGRWTT